MKNTQAEYPTRTITQVRVRGNCFFFYFYFCQYIFYKDGQIANTVDSISNVLFLFEKIKSPAFPILFKFSGEPCYGLIYSPLYE